MFNEDQVAKIEYYLTHYNGNLKLAIAAVRSDERAEMESAALKVKIADAVNKQGIEDFYRVLPFCTMVIGFVAGWLS